MGWLVNQTNSLNRRGKTVFTINSCLTTANQITNPLTTMLSNTSGPASSAQGHAGMLHRAKGIKEFFLLFLWPEERRGLKYDEQVGEGETFQFQRGHNLCIYHWACLLSQNQCFCWGNWSTLVSRVSSDWRKSYPSQKRRPQDKNCLCQRMLYNLKCNFIKFHGFGDKSQNYKSHRGTRRNSHKIYAP